MMDYGATGQQLTRTNRETASPRRTVLFLLIGALLYGFAFFVSERLVYQFGDTNPFFKIATMTSPDVDWLILGASHAMPFDFADTKAAMERETGQTILNLASPGTGPLYNCFVLDHFFDQHRTKNILYVADSFAFYSSTWNEKRFEDAKLLRRTPLDLGLVKRFLQYTIQAGIDPRAFLDYITGFSKLNNSDRFKLDVWEGEADFEREFRPSAFATRKRIAYLYPESFPDPHAFERYLDYFEKLLDTAARRGVNLIIVKLPVPEDFYSKLPSEALFDQKLWELLSRKGLSFIDFSHSIRDARFYSDTDHLNQAGVQLFFKNYLQSILKSD
jgi:hypothetical protein